MFKIVDRTLTALPIEQSHPHKLYQMCQLLVEVRVDYIEVSIPLLKCIGELPEGAKYILRIDSPKQIEEYPGFDKYVCVVSEPQQYEALINELIVDRVQDIEVLDKFKEIKYIRLTGLDNMMQEEYGEVMKYLLQYKGNKLELCAGDNKFCATAIAVEWLGNGGDYITVSFNGIGGYAKLEEVAMATKIILHKKSLMNLAILPKLTEVYEELIGKRISYNKAVIGRNIFNVEAGVYNGVSSNKPLTYEPYDPALVGKKRRLVIGKHSGIGSINFKLKEKGLLLEEKYLEIILKHVQSESIDKRRSLTDKEFMAIVKGVNENAKQMLYC